jgi:hypothetical protein
MNMFRKVSKGQGHWLISDSCENESEYLEVYLPAELLSAYQEASQFEKLLRTESAMTQTNALLNHWRTELWSLYFESH